jgi:hypothetical protein
MATCRRPMKAAISSKRSDVNGRLSFAYYKRAAHHAALFAVRGCIFSEQNSLSAVGENCSERNSHLANQIFCFSSYLGGN